MLNLVVGNLISGVVLKTAMPSWVLFVIFLAIGSVGMFGMLALRKPDVKPSAPVEEPLPIAALLSATVRLFLDKRMLLFLPILVFSGLSQEFFFGQFTGKVGLTIGKDSIGFVMATFGGADVLGSLVSGRLSDVTGRLPMFLAMAVVQVAGLLTSLFSVADMVYMYYIAAVLMGLGDALLNTQIYAVLGFVFPSSSEAAFALFKMFQSFFTAVAFLYGQSSDANEPNIYFISTMVMLGTLVVGTVCVFILGVCVAPIDPKRAAEVGVGPVNVDIEREVSETTPFVHGHTSGYN